MKTKTVCQLNDAGYFVGVVTADESPLEPGVFLIPAGCIEVPPPAGDAGDVHRWDAEAEEWAKVDKRALAADLHKKAVEAIKGALAVQILLDTTARDKGYDHILAAISYAEEPAVPAYQEDGRKFRAWRSLAWAWFHADASLEAKSVAELADLMPKFGA